METPLHYLDTNVLIAIVEPVRSLSRKQSAFLHAVERGQATVITSEFALAECLVKPYADDNEKTAEAYISLFNSGRELIVVPVTQDVLLRAARVRAKSRMSLPDAIHVATAEIVGCTVFVTEDQGIRVNSPMRLSKWMDSGPTQ